MTPSEYRALHARETASQNPEPNLMTMRIFYEDADEVIEGDGSLGITEGGARV